MRWNWPNKPRYKGQERPSDDGRFPVFRSGGGNRHDLTQTCHIVIRQVQDFLVIFIEFQDFRDFL